MMRQSLIFTLAVVAVIAGTVIFSTAHTEDKPQAAVESKDRVKTQAHIVDSSSTPTRKAVKVTIAIEDGWHLNANPASVEGLIPTSVDIQTDPPSKLNVSYPQGKKAESPLGPIDVFEGTVDILATAESDKPIDVSKMRVLLQVQACKTSICYPPSQIVMNVTDEKD